MLGPDREIRGKRRSLVGKREGRVMRIKPNLTTRIPLIHDG
jgi:hypothetical protein